MSKRLRKEEYQSLAELVYDIFFADKLHILGQIYDLIVVYNDPYLAIGTLAYTEILPQFYLKLKELQSSTGSSSEYKDAEAWLYKESMDSLTNLYNEYLAGDKPIEWIYDNNTDDANKPEEADVGWGQLMGHTPNTPKKLASIATRLDQLGRYKQADEIDNIMKLMIKSAQRPK